MEEKKDILVTKSSMPNFDDYCNLIKQLWDSHWLTNCGVLHQQLEEELKSYCDCNNVSLFTNGHSALETAIEFFNLEGEVITTPFTFVSTTHAIVRNGLTPVFCDIREDNYTIDADKIESLITDKTCAIVPVHVYGNICDVEKIEEIAKKHNLKVIYDSAHAFGEKYKGVNVANFGDISMFSFHATKVFNTIEGGCLAYNDDFKNIIEKLKNFGITDPDNIDEIGGNFKMNEFQAAMGILNLKDLPGNIEKRKALMMYYRSLLEGIKGIKLCEIDSNVDYNYSYFPIVVTEEYGISRDELIDLFNKNGIYPRKYFYPITNEISCYDGMGFRGDTPIAHDISSRVLTLPIYPDLDSDDVSRICSIIKNK